MLSLALDGKSFTNSQEFTPLLESDKRHTNGQCSWTQKAWEATAKVAAAQITSMMQSSAM